MQLHYLKQIVPILWLIRLVQSITQSRVISQLYKAAPSGVIYLISSLTCWNRLHTCPCLSAWYFSLVFSKVSPLVFGGVLTHIHWSYSPDRCMSPEFSLCSVLYCLVRSCHSSHLHLSGFSASFCISKYPLHLRFLLLVSKPGAALELLWQLLHLWGITIVVWSSVYLKLLFYMLCIFLLFISVIGKVNPVLALNYIFGEDKNNITDLSFIFK